MTKHAGYDIQANINTKPVWTTELDTHDMAFGSMTIMTKGTHIQQQFQPFKSSCANI